MPPRGSRPPRGRRRRRTRTCGGRRPPPRSGPAGSPPRARCPRRWRSPARADRWAPPCRRQGLPAPAYGVVTRPSGRSGGSEQRDAGGEPVQEIAPAHWPDLARAERAGDRERAEQLVEDRRVVVGDLEEAAAAPVAGEQE